MEFLYFLLEPLESGLLLHEEGSTVIGETLSYIELYRFVDNRVERTVIAAIEDNCILNWLRESTQELRQ